MKLNDYDSDLEEILDLIRYHYPNRRVISEYYEDLLDPHLSKVWVDVITDEDKFEKDLEVLNSSMFDSLFYNGFINHPFIIVDIEFDYDLE